MNTPRKYIVKIITLIVALQLLNLSIYAQDFKPLFVNEETSESNICETITEFVLEGLLGHTNSFPKQTQHHKDLHLHKHISFKATSPLPTSIMFVNVYPIPEWITSLNEDYSSLFNPEINPPPPKKC